MSLRECVAIPFDECVRRASMTLRVDMMAALKDAAEGICPLCHVALVIHDGQGCCPCCGDAYRAGLGRLEMSRCDFHGRDCDHWRAIWASGSREIDESSRP